jgi:hypothetical protein
VSFWAENSDTTAYPGDFMTVSAGNGSLTLGPSTPFSWALYSFTFTGTGSDTLSISAVNNPGAYYVDDVNVPNPAPGAGLASLALLVLLGALRQAREVSAR